MINKYLINEMTKMRRDNMNCKPYEHKWVHQETTLSRIMPPVGEAIDKFPETRTATFKCANSNCDATQTTLTEESWKDVENDCE